MWTSEVLYSAVQDELCIAVCDTVLVYVAPVDVSRVLTAVTFRVTILVPEYESTRFFQNVTLLIKRHGVTFRETGVFD